MWNEFNIEQLLADGGKLQVELCWPCRIYNSGTFDSLFEILIEKKNYLLDFRWTWCSSAQPYSNRGIWGATSLDPWMRKYGDFSLEVDSFQFQSTVSIISGNLRQWCFHWVFFSGFLGSVVIYSTLKRTSSPICLRSLTAYRLIYLLGLDSLKFFLAFLFDLHHRSKNQTKVTFTINYDFGSFNHLIGFSKLQPIGAHWLFEEKPMIRTNLNCIFRSFIQNSNDAWNDWIRFQLNVDLGSADIIFPLFLERRSANGITWQMEALSNQPSELQRIWTNLNELDWIGLCNTCEDWTTHFQ